LAERTSLAGKREKSRDEDRAAWEANGFRLRHHRKGLYVIFEKPPKLSRSTAMPKKVTS
jgi:hypothetical protein